MRLGSYPLSWRKLAVAELYGTTHVTERHRHRYEVNVAYKIVCAKRLRISGQSPDGELTEFVELPQTCTLLCGHPGSPGVQVSPDQAAPRSPAWSRPRSTISGALTHFRAVHNIAA